MNNFILRTITGAVFVSVIVGSLLWNHIAFATVFGVFTLFGLCEFYNLIKKQYPSFNYIFATIVGCIVFIVSFVFNHSYFSENYFPIAAAGAFALSFIIFIIQLFLNKPDPFLSVAFSFLGILYIAVPFAMLVHIPTISQTDQYLPAIVLGYFIILWTNDTFAYLTGMMIGKHKLYEKISPKKTWEGFIGGLTFAMIAGFGLSLKFPLLSTLQWIILSAIIVVTGTLGDLTESMLKRSIGCKDSGTFFPGHGGILDRFDSILISAPFVFFYLLLFLN